MCLYTNQTEVDVADKDISVYKILLPGRVSPFFAFYWKEGRLIRHFESLLIYDREVDRGFHAYTSLYEANYRLPAAGIKARVYLATIPKGSQIVRSSICDEIVSNKLRVGRPIPEKRKKRK